MTLAWDETDESKLMQKALATVQGVQVDEHSFTSWQEYIQFYFGQNQVKVLIYSPHHLLPIIAPLLDVANQWSTVNRRLFAIYVYVFMMCQVHKTIVDIESQPSWITYQHQSLQRILSICEVHVSKLIEDLSELQGEALLFAPESLWWTIISHVHDEFLRIATNDHIPPCFSLVYLRLWILVSSYTNEGLSTADDLYTADNSDGSGNFVTAKIRDELERVQTAFVTWTKQDEQLNEAFMGALLALYVLQHQDVQALALLNQYPELAMLETTQLAMQRIANLGDTERRILWLRQISQHLQGIRYHRVIVRDYAELWIDAVTDNLDLLTECRSFLTAHLPMTNGYLETLLLRTGDYRGWVEVQLLERLDPLYVPVATFKPIEKANRELLLPIYHQAVERYVQNKNRDSYKRAVRLLVKLASHYKKLKQFSIWEAFLQQFVIRHSRLRSLHEEMRKKGLIS